MKDISSDEKAYLIDLINTKKKYGLVWEDKPEDVEEQLRRELPVFKELKDKAIISDDPEAPNHILIEGDNLHALTALTYTHKGRIDVIYIDPPYNTENKDFKYNDTFVDLEDSFRHSKWLSFMHKRLEIAEKLLSKDGIIFISIDDNEQAQLKLLCDEVFGELNYHGAITWIKKTKPINSGKAKFQLQTQVEYIHTYTRIKKSVHPGFKLRELGVRNYKEYDKIGYCRLFDLEDSDTGVKNRETMKFPILGVLPGEGKRWKIGLEKANTLIESGLIVIYEGKVKQVIYPENDDQPLKPFWSHFTKEDGKTAEDGKKLLSDIIGKKHNFDTVKPVQLITEILYATTKKDSIILDFFAGSGTTHHATMLLNSEDNGKRQCILVTNNENNICEEITYPRLKNVINGYVSNRVNKVSLFNEKITFTKLNKIQEILLNINHIKEENHEIYDTIKVGVKDNSIIVEGEIKKGNKTPGLEQNNLRYYQTDYVSSTINEQNRRLLTERSTELICIKEDCYTDVTKEHKSIKPHLARIFTDRRGKYLVVIYHSFVQYEVIQKLIEIIPTLETEEKVKVYSFSPEKETIDEEFISIIDKIESVPLPESIYNTYKQCFRAIKLDRETAVEPEKTDDNVYLI